MDNKTDSEVIIARAEKALQDLIDLLPVLRAHANSLRSACEQAALWNPYDHSEWCGSMHCETCQNNRLDGEGEG